MGLAKRTKIALVVTGFILAPCLVMLAVTFVGTGQAQMFATWASLPAIAGVAAAALGGRRFAIIASIVMAFAAPLTIVAGLSPVAGAAFMALSCMFVGRLSVFGLHRSALLVPVMMAWPLIDPPAWNGQAQVDRLDTPYLLWMAVTFFVGAIIPAVALPYLMRKRPAPKPQPNPRSEAVPYTVMITVLVTVSTFVVLDNPKDFGGAFLIAAILVLAPVGQSQTLRPTVVRVVATLAGSLLLIALLSQVSSLAVIYIVGLVMAVAALVAKLGPRGWIYYVLMMPATACLNSTTLVQVGELGKQRVIDNAVGGVLVLVASALAIVYSHWAARRGHAEDKDVEVAQLAPATA